MLNKGERQKRQRRIFAQLVKAEDKALTKRRYGTPLVQVVTSVRIGIAREHDLSLWALERIIRHGIDEQWSPLRAAS